MREVEQLILPTPMLIAKRFRLLGEPLRLRLLHVLESGEHSVGEMSLALGSNQPNVSRHLAALLHGGLLNRRREGTTIYYSIADPAVFQLCELVCQSAIDQMHARLSAMGKRAKAGRG